MSRAGTRNANSLHTKMAKFFADNPGEELSYEDVCVKFDANPRTVQNVVSRSTNDDDSGFEVVRVIRAKRVPYEFINPQSSGA